MLQSSFYLLISHCSLMNRMVGEHLFSFYFKASVIRMILLLFFILIVILCVTIISLCALFVVFGHTSLSVIKLMIFFSFLRISIRVSYFFFINYLSFWHLTLDINFYLFLFYFRELFNHFRSTFSTILVIDSLFINYFCIL